MQWETVIGLEVHAQLNTQSKIFSGSSTRYGAEPNTQASAIDLGFPGMLPVLNKVVVEKAIIFGLAISAEINMHSVFERKNYFYPDLPKGYQISQFDIPIVGAGHLNILFNDQQKRIGITRAHLEEDAGKSLHADFDGCSGIDLNRAGVPLLEIVSEPDLRSAEEAVIYLKTLHQLVRYLDICDGNMQEGSFRCDANVSIRPVGTIEFGTRTELKNINSFRFVEKAIKYEIARQIDVLESGGTVIQETRLYDSEKNETRSMRSKESAHDYRYFPDPDLLPVVVTAETLAHIKNTMPELPRAKFERFQAEYHLSEYDALVLTQNRDLADFYETAVQIVGQTPDVTKVCANWVMGEFLGALNKAHLNVLESPISATALGNLVRLITQKTISGKIAKQVFEEMWDTGGDPETIVKTKNLQQVTDDGAILDLVEQVLTNNPTQLANYFDGKDKLFGFFVGQVMKLSQGKANPQQVNTVIKQKLDARRPQS